MRRPMLFPPFVLAASIAVLAALPAAAGTADRELTGRFDVAPGHTVRIEIAVAELRIEADDGADVRAELHLRCRWDRKRDCRGALDEIELAAHRTSRRLYLELTGLPAWHRSNLEIEGTIYVPRSLALDVDLGVGELEVIGVASDLRVDLGVGEVEVRTAHAAVASVELDVGVGEAELHGRRTRVDGSRSLLVGSELYWDDGPGEARIRVDCGVGEISVRLE